MIAAVTLMSDRKRASCCSACHREVFDAISRFEEPHPYAGQIQRAGAPHADAVRVTFVLTDGSRANMTFCVDCETKIAPENLPDVWRNVMAAFAFERKWYKALTGRARSDAVQAAVDDDLLALADKVPLGIIASERWTDIIKRETASGS